MKLTKLQRYTAYCIMLQEAENQEHEWVMVGFCCMCLDLFDLTDCYDNPSEFVPEIYIQRNNDSDYWIEGDWSDRVEILKQAIKITCP